MQTNGDRGNTKEYWDKKWSSKRTRVEKWTMKRTTWRIPKGASVLDIGCGNGKLLKYLPEGCNGYGIDVSEVAIRKLKALGLEGEVMNAYNIDKLHKKFDFIAANHLLEHLERDDEFVKKCYNQLNDNGILYMAVPNDMSHPDETTEHCQMYNENTLKVLVSRYFPKVEIKIYGNHLTAICTKTK